MNFPAITRFLIPPKRVIFFLIACFLAFVTTLAQSYAEAVKIIPASGPLRVSKENPRYFSDADGKIVYLTGSHVWDNFQDWGGSTPNFDYAAYLDVLKTHNHNFIRLWKIGENTVKNDGIIFPMPWARPGPELANDGRPKFDLLQFNEAYFERLGSRVIQARNRGIYVSIMLFDGIYEWSTHPFHSANNINGVDGGDTLFFGLHSVAVNRLQKQYVRKVIDTVNDLNNVLYEVGNEIRRPSIAWQYDLINFIHACEKNKPKQHPVGMTSTGGSQDDDITNDDLLKSPADWISPRSSEPAQNYSYNPPSATGKKVIISDTDHLWGVLSDPTADWVWKSFLRGLNPILMDVLQNVAPGTTEKWNDAKRLGLAEARWAMGQTLNYANRLDLSKMVPQVELASTKYCLADPGHSYLIYYSTVDVPKREKLLQRMFFLDRKISLDLYGVSGVFRMEWFNPVTGEFIDGGTTRGGNNRIFKIPFDGDALLYLFEVDVEKGGRLTNQ